MVEREYLMRQLSELTKVLARLLLHRREQRHAEALQEIQTSGALFLGLSFADARAVSYDALAAALRERRLDAPGPASDVAELLLHRGEIDLLEGRADEGRHSLGLALHLYLDLSTRGGDTHAPGHAARIDHLLAQLGPYALPPDVLALLVRYHEAAGRFDQAENVLFVLAEQPDDDVRALGMGFYDRLHRRTNAALQAGGLSREEVYEGREAFARLFPEQPR